MDWFRNEVIGRVSPRVKRLSGFFTNGICRGHNSLRRLDGGQDL